MSKTEKILHAYLAIACIAGSTDFKNVLKHYEDNAHDVNHVACMMLDKAASKINDRDAFDSISFLLGLID